MYICEGVGGKLTHCRHRYAELAVMGAIRQVPARGVSTGQRAAGGQVSEPVSISSLLWIRVVAMQRFAHQPGGPPLHRWATTRLLQSSPPGMDRKWGWSPGGGTQFDADCKAAFWEATGSPIQQPASMKIYEKTNPVYMTA